MGDFGAHYKGDVSEVTMGHETGLYIESGEPLTWSASPDSTSVDYLLARLVLQVQLAQTHLLVF